MPRNRGGNRGGGSGKQGGNISIQDFTFVGPRSNATINFRVMRGNKPVPDAVASFILGLNNLKYKTLLAIGGKGPDANDPWVIRTTNLGIGYKDKIDLSSFSYEEYNRITILVEDAQHQTTEMDSKENFPTAPISPKPKRIEVSGEPIIKTSGDWFNINFSTKKTDGTPEPNVEVEIESTEKITVQDRDSDTLICEKQTRCVIRTGGNGKFRIKIKLEAPDAEIVFTHLESLEEVKKKFQYEA